MPSELASEVLAALDQLSGGVHPGFRPAAGAAFLTPKQAKEKTADFLVAEMSFSNQR